MTDLPSRALWLALADAADAETLSRFRAGGGIDNKLTGGGYDPVTEADREAERAIRAILSERRPGDAVLGEEHGEVSGASSYRWVIDPIDGTRAFVAGLPVWTTLIGLERDGWAVAGLVSQPVTGERFLADGTDATVLVRGEKRALRVSGRTDPAETVAMTTDPYLLSDVPEALESIRASVRLMRYGTDAYAFCALAAGTVDLVLERGVQPYDVCAPIALVEAAGGIATNWRGGRAELGGDILCAASSELHEWALERLAPHAL